jgi:CubicO group peptidase (beta-lactamase class C family)
VRTEVPKRIRDALQRQLDAGCAAGVFPGASACVAVWEGRAWRYVDACAGVHTHEAQEVTPDTIYDLASLTKPLVGTTALRLHQSGQFPLEARIDALVPALALDSFLPGRTATAAIDAQVEL